MTSVGIVSSNSDNNSLSSLETVEKGKRRIHDVAHLKQYMHEKKVDEFFWTDTEAPHKRTSPLAIIGSVVGVMAPILFLGRKKLINQNLSPLKKAFEKINIDYGAKELIAVGGGGVIGGLLGGLLDRKEKNKIDKLEEASFQMMNITFPALLVGGVIKLLEKTPKLNKIPFKIAASGLGIFAGANLAVKASNKLDDKLFDKYVIDEERKFKKKDFIVHIDDVFGAMVLSKIPFADKLQRILPAVFAWSGYHVGES